MKRLMLATLAGAALLAGAGAANAQAYYDDGYGYNGWNAPGVGVQVGPVGAFVSAPVAAVGPGYGYSSYGYAAPDYSYSYSTPWNSSAPRGGTYKMRAFKSQELLPQSPPEGGY